MKDFYCVKNNTWCIDTGRTLIGVYRLNDSDVIMLDSGSAMGGTETKKLMEVIGGAQLNVRAVIATHGHLDHIGNNDLLKDLSTAIYICTEPRPICAGIWKALGCSTAFRHTER